MCVYIVSMNSQTIQPKLFAIAEPNRFNILQILKEGPSSVSEIVGKLGISQPHVSRHLRILAELGIVRVQKKAQLRIYSIEAQPFQEINAWLQSFSQVWDDRMDNLEEYLNKM